MTVNEGTCQQAKGHEITASLSVASLVGAPVGDAAPAFNGEGADPSPIRTLADCTLARTAPYRCGRLRPGDGITKLSG